MYNISFIDGGVLRHTIAFTVWNYSPVFAPNGYIGEITYSLLFLDILGRLNINLNNDLNL